MSRLMFSIFWNPEEIGSSASEGTDVLTRGGQAGKQQNLLSPISVHRLPGEGLAQTEGLDHIKIWIKDMCLPTSKAWVVCGFTHFQPSKNRLSQECALHFWISVYPRYHQVDNQQ